MKIQIGGFFGTNLGKTAGGTLLNISVAVSVLSYHFINSFVNIRQKIIFPKRHESVFRCRSQLIEWNTCPPPHHHNIPMYYINSITQDMRQQHALIRRVTLLAFIVISLAINSISYTVGTESPIVRTAQFVEAGADSTTRSSDSQHRNTQALRGQGKKSAFQFGLAVAHCQEEDMAWINTVDDIQLPDEHGQPQSTTWDPVVYERCGQKVSEKYSHYQRNIGSEECTAYLQYIVDRYEDLPEIVYFLQADALSLNEGKGERHTNFTSLQDLVAASAPLMLAPGDDSNDAIGFLSMGKDTTAERTKVVQRDSPVNNPEEVLHLMKGRAPAYGENTMLELIPGACFAVRRERIWAQPSEFYKDLFLKTMANEDERRLCWSMEATWHVIFGEPLVIPHTARLMHHLDGESAWAS